eukprot:Gregarina_sp_Poly_1__7821@NODE_442_length_8345_cov_11_503503_g360_i0_p5_GENE_NODE_442_length_8345_cov_11_503503_g360_i0NODE_442_length_8345_cov_11_503503_g360_i0_p5_ORF_typecomplete_len173_score16_11IMP2_N/PF18590_1/1_5e18IMP2_C/PF18591_1/1_5e11_NODE_442_length_8345_cov_11_503503_g360_i076328150
MGGICSTGSGTSETYEKGGMSHGFCYLIFEKSNGGTVSVQYAHSDPPEYMAKATPNRPIPNHKFTGNGKTPLKSKCSEKKDFFNCWCQWLKEMKRLDAEIEMKPEGGYSALFPTLIVLHNPDNTIVKCGTEFSLSDADACAACPPATQDFNAHTMEQGLFMQKARGFAGLAF